MPPPDISFLGLCKSYIRKYPKNSLILAILSLAYPIDSVVTAILFGKFAKAAGEGDKRKMLIYISLIAGLNALVLVMYNIDLYSSQVFSVGMMTHIQEELMLYIFDTRSTGVDSVPTTELIVHMRMYTGFMSKRINIMRNDIIPNILALSFQAIYMLKIDKMLFGMISFIVIVIGIAIWNSLSKNVKESADSTKADANIFEYIGDILDNFVSVIDNDGVQREMDVLKELGAESRNARALAVKKSLRVSTFVNGVAIVVAVAFFVRLYKKFVSNRTPESIKANLDKIVTSITILFEALNSVRALIYIIYEITYGSSGIKEVRKVFEQFESAARDFKLENEGYDDDLTVLPSLSLSAMAGEEATTINAITLQNVSFSYGDGKQCINDLSLSFPIGSKTSIVGENGSGKTTLLRIIMKHVTPQAGTILFFGRDYSIIKPSALRSRIAYAGQHGKLFNRSIYDNIVYSRPTSTLSDVQNHIKGLGLEDFFLQFPNGLNTVVGIGGKNLSGGQRQIVQLTRILFQDADVILLDEITASVDSKHKALIVDIINRMFSEKTIVFISHDPDLHQLSTRTITAVDGKFLKEKLESM